MPFGVEVVPSPISAPNEVSRNVTSDSFYAYHLLQLSEPNKPVQIDVYPRPWNASLQVIIGKFKCTAKEYARHFTLVFSVVPLDVCQQWVLISVIHCGWLHEIAAFTIRITSLSVLGTLPAINENRPHRDEKFFLEYKPLKSSQFKSTEILQMQFLGIIYSMP